jgi:hypothetical protein
MALWKRASTEHARKRSKFSANGLQSAIETEELSENYQIVSSEHVWAEMRKENDHLLKIQNLHHKCHVDSHAPKIPQNSTYRWFRAINTTSAKSWLEFCINQQKSCSTDRKMIRKRKEMSLMCTSDTEWLRDFNRDDENRGQIHRE